MRGAPGGRVKINRSLRRRHPGIGLLRLSTIRRRLLLGAGSVLVLSGLSLMVVHTGLVRRFALVQLQTRLGNTIGLAIEAKDLDYNLFASHFELKEITFRSAQSIDMPAPLKARAEAKGITRARTTAMRYL